jgi:NADH dehydrogenase FAD-containing subunit
MNESTEQNPSVLVVGGGYGGAKVAKALDDVAEVTLVDPSEAFHHNVASLRALVQPDWLDRIFFPYEHLLSNGRFVLDRAVEVEGRRVTLGSGERLEPDYLVLATGSSYPFPAKSDEPSTERARDLYRGAHSVLAEAGRVLIVGAGPAGLELAGEIKATFPHKDVTVADVAEDVLEGPYDQALRDELRRQLAELGVTLELGSPLRQLPDAPPATAAAIEVETAAGRTLRADVWFRAFGVDIQTGYLRGSLAEALDVEGYVRVDEQMRVLGHDRVFAVGDISDADRNMAGMAGMQAEVVAANIRALISGEVELVAYQRFPAAIVVPLGPGGGAGQLPGSDGIVGPDVASELKGQSFGVDKLAAMFDAATSVTGSR